MDEFPQFISVGGDLTPLQIKKQIMYLTKHIYLAILPNKKVLFFEEDKAMAKFNQKKVELRSDILKALAHPSRLFIVEELAVRERCVCELTEMIGSDISTISKHLSVLKNAGIVADDKRGTSVYYSLKVPCILKFLDCVENVIMNNLKEAKSLK